MARAATARQPLDDPRIVQLSWLGVRGRYCQSTLRSVLVDNRVIMLRRLWSASGHRRSLLAWATLDLGGATLRSGRVDSCCTWPPVRTANSGDNATKIDSSEVQGTLRVLSCSSDNGICQPSDCRHDREALPTRG
jgi:hypothetical protein